MDSTFAIMNVSANVVPKGIERNRSSGFWGENTRGSFNGRFCNFQQLKSSQSRNFFKPGFAHAVYTPDQKKEALEIQRPIFQCPKGNPQNVAAIILGGGAGTQLFPLTSTRAKAAVPIGGCYRLIDIPMSNCINSGITKVFVVTQYNSFSLNDHLTRAYNFVSGTNREDFVEVLSTAENPRQEGNKWFEGTADAVRRFIWVFEDAKLKNIENILIISGDHLCRMDYMKLVEKHIEMNAEITVSCATMDESRASNYGLMKIDGNGRIVWFDENPKGSSMKKMQNDTTLLGLTYEEALENPYIAPMGVFVFRTETFLKQLRWKSPSSDDFGSEIISSALREHQVQACLFEDYWKDIGTLKSFFDANLALTAQDQKFELYDPKTPFFTYPRFLPPTRIVKSKIVDAIISHGCFLNECNVQHSIVGVRSRLESGSELKDTMMMGADYYQTDSEIESLLKEGNVPIGVGENTKIRNCIIDKNAMIGKNVMIANYDGVQEADRPEEGFYIRSGITVIVKDATIKDGTII